MTIYIYSTLTAGQDYTTDAGIVSINGKSNVVRNGAEETPLGVLTEITDAQFDELKKNPVYQQHETNKFIVATTTKYNPEDVAQDMQANDASAQRTSEDLTASTGLDVIENKASESTTSSTTTRRK